MLPACTSKERVRHLFQVINICFVIIISGLGKCDEIISVRSVCFSSSISYQQNIACAYLSIHFDFLSDARIIFNFNA